jgi:hypothetical protein
MIFTDWIHRFALDTLTSQDLARLHAAFEAGQHHEREACAKLLDDATGTNSIVSCASAAKAIRARNQE